jgi:hypothetical protein
MLAALVLTAPLQPVWPLVVVAAALLAIVAVEWSGPDPGLSETHQAGLAAGG